MLKMLVFLLALLAGSPAFAQMAVSPLHPAPQDQTHEEEVLEETTATKPAEPAEPQNLFEVRDVMVDETAESASAARDKALAAGQKQALGTLLSRMGGSALDTANYDENQVSSLVQNFEIVTEKASAVRYIATLSVSFKPDAIRSLLGGAGVTYSETRSRPVLVLPVVIKDGRAVLWEEPTPWAGAWQKSLITTGLVPMIVPMGDLDDVKIIGATEVMEGKPGMLTRAASHYRTAGIIVPVVEMTGEELDLNDDLLTVAINRFDENGKLAPPFTVKVKKDDGLADEALLARAVAQVRGQLEQGWRQSTQVATGPQARLPVQVRIGGPQDWAMVRQRLTKVPNVQKIEIISLTRDQASAQLLFRGTIPELQSSLTKVNLDLAQDSYAGVWELRVRAP